MKTTWKMTMGLWLAGAASAFAQADQAAPSAEMLTLAQLMQMGGWLMYVLAALSVLGLALIVYYSMVLRERNIAPAAQALRLRELLKERRGRDARELCAQQPTALAAVAAAGLDFLKENPQAKSDVLKEVMESEGSRQAGRMQNMIHYLLDLSAVAPMVGRGTSITRTGPPLIAWTTCFMTVRSLEGVGIAGAISLGLGGGTTDGSTGGRGRGATSVGCQQDMSGSQ